MAGNYIVSTRKKHKITHCFIKNKKGRLWNKMKYYKVIVQTYTKPQNGCA